MAIDVWMQQPTDRLLQSPFITSLHKWIPSIPRVAVSVEAVIQLLDEANVQSALLSAWYGPQGPLISNEEVHAWTRQHPNRFFGIAGVDLRHPMQAIETLRKCVHDRGFKGLRVIQWLWEKPCTDPLYYPLFAECVQLNIPVCLSVGLTGPLQTSETGRPLHIERVALDFPELKIVCGHLGYPWQQEMIAFATKFPNVYIDTSAYKCKRFPMEIVNYMKTNGRKKVLFGSNYPMLTPAECLADLETLGLTSDAVEDFLVNNAKQVFKL